MKVLHVTQGYYPTIGGTEWLIQRVSEELVQQFDDQVTVFTTNCYNGEAFFNPKLPRLSVGWEEINGVRVRRFPVLSRISQLLRIPQSIAYTLRLPGNQHLRALAGGPIIPSITKAIREFPTDVIGASSFPLLHMFAALEAAQNSGQPCVLHGGLHPQDDWGYNRPMIYQAIQKASYYIANTQYEANYVTDRGALPGRVSTIGVGVDPSIFENISTKEAKQRLGLEGKKVVGFIGQLGTHKGIDTLIQAMPLVWQYEPDVHFLLAGARTMFDKSMTEMLDRLSNQERKKIILRYNFPEEEKPWLFGAVDVFAYPSGYESFGIAFLEAWILEKPVIGCRRGAIPWVISPGRDGLLVDYQNKKMLAEAVITLIKNPLWAQVLGQTGKKKVLAHYTWPEVARRFRQVYADAIQKNSV